MPDLDQADESMAMAIVRAPGERPGWLGAKIPLASWRIYLE